MLKSYQVTKSFGNQEQNRGADIIQDFNGRYWFQE
jgi:hypothetical protein